MLGLIVNLESDDGWREWASLVSHGWCLWWPLIALLGTWLTPSFAHIGPRSPTSCQREWSHCWRRSLGNIMWDVVCYLITSMWYSLFQLTGVESEEGGLKWASLTLASHWWCLWWPRIVLLDTKLIPILAHRVHISLTPCRREIWVHGVFAWDVFLCYNIKGLAKNICPDYCGLAFSIICQMVVESMKMVTYSSWNSGKRKSFVFSTPTFHNGM